MSDRPWYKRYPADFISGTLSLTLEQKGAYSIILDLIYDRGGPIPDDPQWIGRVCGCSTRKWKTIRETLIQASKLTSEKGLLRNVRAEKQLENDAKTARKLSENAFKKHRKPSEKKPSLQENNDLAKKGHMHTRALPDTICQKPEGSSAKAPLPSRAVSDAEIIHDKCCEQIGVSRETHTGFAASTWTQSFLNAGAAAEDIFDGVKAGLVSLAGDEPSSMRYFEKPIMRAKATRERVVPEGKARASPMESPHTARLDAWSELLDEIDEKRSCNN